MPKIKVTQVRKGKRVTFLTKDKGKLGKTPKHEQWYEPGVETGWEKDMPEGERRQLVLQAHKGDELSSARSMQALANVTTDRETRQKARADAQYFFRRHRVGKRPVTTKPRVKKVVKEKVPAVPEEVKAKVEGLWDTYKDYGVAVKEATRLRRQGWTVRIVEVGKGARYKVKLWVIPKAVPAVEEVKPRLGGKAPRITPKTPRLRR